MAAEARVRELFDQLEADCWDIPTGLLERVVEAIQPHPSDANMDVPYQDVDEADSVARAGADSMRTALGLAEGVIVADTVVVRALGIDTQLGRIGAVMHDFALGNPFGPAMPVASVLYLGGSPDLLRKYGVLVRDCANGAANTAAQP